MREGRKQEKGEMERKKRGKSGKHIRNWGGGGGEKMKRGGGGTKEERPKNERKKDSGGKCDAIRSCSTLVLPLSLSISQGFAKC